MNKILILTLFLIGCSNSNEVTITKEEYNKLKGDTIKPKYPKPFKLYDKGMSWSTAEGIVLGSDGHEYLIIDWGSSGKNVGHYIDCEKCLKRNKKDSL